MLVLGSVASQNTKSFLITPSFESIATVTVGAGGASPITFTSIPSTYTHLQLRGQLRSNISATGGEYCLIQFNGDTGGNYSWHYMGGLGTGAAYSGGYANTTSIAGSQVATCNNDLASAFGGNVWDIPDYSNTNKYKTIRMLNGWSGSAAGVVGMDTGNWRSTAAINAIRIYPGSGSLWQQYSTFALYGIKVA